MQLVFATSNPHKLREAQEILGIDIDSTNLDIPEIQSLDPVKVAIHKAISYFTALSKPVLTEDTSLVFKALNGLPGPYINDFSKALNNSGLIKLLTNSPDRIATAITTLVYCDSSTHTEVFQGEIPGSISHQELGDQGFGWDPIFIPDGQQLTFAQMNSQQKNKYSMRGMAFEKFRFWLDYHSDKV